MEMPRNSNLYRDRNELGLSFPLIWFIEHRGYFRSCCPLQRKDNRSSCLEEHSQHCLFVSEWWIIFLICLYCHQWLAPFPVESPSTATLQLSNIIYPAPYASCTTLIFSSFLPSSPLFSTFIHSLLLFTSIRCL